MSIANFSVLLNNLYMLFHEFRKKYIEYTNDKVYNRKQEDKIDEEK